MERGTDIKPIRPVPVGFLRTKARRLLRRSADEFLVFAGILRIARQHAPNLLRASSVTVVRVPEEWSAICVRAINEVFDIEDRRNSPYAVFCHPDKRGKSEDIDFDAALKRLHLFVLADIHTELVPEIEITKSADFALDFCTNRDLRALSRLLHTGPLSAEDCDYVRGQPPATLNAFFRPGRPARSAIDKLRGLDRTEDKAKEFLSLDTLPGLGSIGQWGRDLAIDIEAWRQGVLDWSAIDKGMLLYGPPGTGKTLFASALARTCKMNFVPASLAKWQSMGHLGETLKAMRKSFNEAKNQAPALLFIDEVDSIGDREQFIGEYVPYHVEVVNSLLELLDGSAGRDGVIVVGACNDPKRLDKALLRAGRLEKHVFFDYPDEAGRLEILAHYLPEIADDPTMLELAKRFAGWSQADLNRHSRQARKSARRDGRELVTVTDLLLDLPEKRDITEELLRRFALHEAGHAVCALALGRSLDYVNINLQFDEADKSGHLGITMLLGEEPIFKVHSDLTRRITIYLAGLASEEIFLAERSTSGGGAEDCDLARATELAHALVSKFGLSRRLVVAPKSTVEDLRRDNYLRIEVEEILQEQFKIAKEILLIASDAVKEIAEILVSSGHCSGELAIDIYSRPRVLPNAPVAAA